MQTFRAVPARLSTGDPLGPLLSCDGLDEDMRREQVMRQRAREQREWRDVGEARQADLSQPSARTRRAFHAPGRPDMDPVFDGLGQLYQIF